MSGGAGPVARRGCLTGVLVFSLIALGFGSYWLYVYNKFNPPEELKPYATRESTMEFITSKNPAPGSGQRLTEEDLQFYLDSFDSLNSGWRVFEIAWDSAKAARDPGDDEKFDPLELDDVGVIFFQTNLYARRSLINYLNQRQKSWDEYMWAKRRTIAASGITQQEFTDTLRNFMKRNDFNLQDEEGEEVQLASQDLFKEVREIRQGGVDSTEQALVAPYRTTLLIKGIHSLTQTEEQFYGENE